jgi:propionate CoA-transferase
MSKTVPVEEAVECIPDGGVVSVCGAWMLVPEMTLSAVEKRFLETGHPRDLTAVFAICPGGVREQLGIEHLAREGLLRRAIGGSYPNAADSPLRRLIHSDKILAYNFPSGMLTQWLREVGAGRPGVLTRKGIGTFVDPRQDGGRMNGCTTENLIRRVNVDGEELLFLAAFPVDVAIIRATTADEAGNLTMEHESATLTAFVQAAAAKASGGKVIAQVKRMTETGSLNPHMVKVPGSLVDLVVVDPNQIQASGIPYDPALSGEIRRPLNPVAAGSEIERFIARRAAEELEKGDVVVLGYGLSALVPYLLVEQGRSREFTFAIEHGSLGGIPLRDFAFGSSLNPLAILDAASQFDLFQGGCFDKAILSFLQVDEAGRVNVHKLGDRPHLSVGIGGFLDIAASARKIVFVGYFTAGGLEIEAAGATLKIIREGRNRKFVKRVGHVSFDPRYSAVREIVYVTERAVLRRVSEKIVLEEVTPGVDVRRDILEQMEFQPVIREGLRTGG